jgi:ACS family glucarate transporter-like MFS transporter
LEPRRRVLLLLIALAIITFLDRISIAVAGPRIQADLHISPERWGWVIGAFVLAYGIFEIPTGALGDRMGQRSVLTRIVLWWSGFTCLTGGATGFVPLLATRFLFGAGEAGAFPNMSGVIARWFPLRERARAHGFIWAASRFGGALAPLIVVPLQSAVGWRVTFILLGAIGVVWALFWRALYQDRPAGGGAELPGLHPIVPWAELLRQRQLWLIVTMYFCYAWGSWFYFGWFPVYLVKAAGFSEGEMGIFTALPFFAGALGNIAGGFLCDWLAGRFGLKTGRRLVGFVSLAVSALLLVAMTLTRNKSAIVVLSTLGFGVADLMLPAAWAVCLDVGHRYAGVVTGTMNSAGQLGGFVCSVLFGYLVQAWGNYYQPLWLVACMVMVAALLFTRIDPTRPLVAEDRVPDSGPRQSMDRQPAHR